ncbi:MAG: hypothetical protein JW994_04055 [Candidatus Omnitrophica bacterium]|nr:hypothetical protein [Candidatus Omnitrophota bacterium]
MKNRLEGDCPGKNDDFAYKEIIDTFFRKSLDEGTLPKKHLKRKLWIPFAVTSAVALTLALFAIIIILNKINTGPEHVKIEPAYSEPIINNGVINRNNIEEVSFEGDAREASSFLEGSINLVNHGSYGRAGLTLKFHRPVNLKGKNILLIARAKYGTKKINLILKDSKNCFLELAHIAFPADWSMKHVFMKENRHCDLSDIKELKIEFGTNTAGNNTGSVIFLKNLTVRDTI